MSGWVEFYFWSIFFSAMTSIAVFAVAYPFFRGKQGMTGMQGIPGPKGPTGLYGRDGEDGKDGKSFEIGPDSYKQIVDYYFQQVINRMSDQGIKLTTKEMHDFIQDEQRSWLAAAIKNHEIGSRKVWKKRRRAVSGPRGDKCEKEGRPNIYGCIPTGPTQEEIEELIKQTLAESVVEFPFERSQGIARSKANKTVLKNRLFK